MIYFPPKPTLISLEQNLFEDLNKDPRFVAELKYNGDRLILQTEGGKDFQFWNRSGSQFTKYTPSPFLIRHLKEFKWGKGLWVCDGELLHFKTTGIKHHVILFDMFVRGGDSLKMKTFLERREALEELVDGKIFEDVLPAKWWSTGFREVFNEYTKRSEIEGLVMKRLDAKLILGLKSSPVVKYMFKVRKPNGSYRF